MQQLDRLQVLLNHDRNRFHSGFSVDSHNKKKSSQVIEGGNSLNLPSAPSRLSIVIPAIDMKHDGSNCCYSAAIMCPSGTNNLFTVTLLPLAALCLYNDIFFSLVGPLTHRVLPLPLSNLQDKDSKIVFLQKAIDVVMLVSGEPLAAKPARIVAGHEPEKTNELLQVMAKCCLNKVCVQFASREIKHAYWQFTTYISNEIVSLAM